MGHLNMFRSALKIIYLVHSRIHIVYAPEH